MRYSKYVGDICIDLEGEPQEIIQVLKYLDGVEDKGGEIAFKINGKEISRGVIYDIRRVDS